MRIKKFAILAIVMTGALGAGLAQAGPEVHWSVTIGAPLWRVHGEAAPVDLRPHRAHLPPPPYLPPARGHRHATRWDRDGDGIPNRFDRYDDRRHGHPDDWRGGRPEGRYGDRDRDGLPDHRDRHPGDPRRH